MLLAVPALNSESKPDDAGSVQQDSVDQLTIQRRFRMIRGISIFFSFSIILFGAFYPWMWTRSASSKKLASILGSHAISLSQLISRSANQSIQSHENFNRYFSGLVSDPRILYCNASAEDHFIRFCQLSHELLQPEPTRIYLLESETHICRCLWKPNGELTYQYSAKSTTFSEYLKTIYPDTNVSSNTTGSSKGAPASSSTIAFSLSEPKNEFHPSYIVGTTVLTSSIAEMVTDALNSIDSRFAMLFSGNQVIIEGKKGKVQIMSPVPNSSFRYPSLDEIGSPFWNEVSTILPKIQLGSNSFYNIGGTSYLISRSVIGSSKKGAHFNIVVAIDFEYILSAFLIPTANIFMVTIAIIISITTSSMFFLTAVTKRSREYLENPPQIYLLEGELDWTVGAVGRSIQHLRSIEIRYPSDHSFVQAVDSAANSLAVEKELLFSPSASLRCQFCKAFTNNRIKNGSATLSGPYKLWTEVRRPFLGCYHFGNVCTFDWDLHLANPAKQLVLLYSSIIINNHPLIPFYDPDQTVLFVKSYATQYCKSPILATLTLHAMNFLLCGPFSSWVLSKFDFYVVLFCAMTQNTDIEALRRDGFSDNFVGRNEKETQFFSIIKRKGGAEELSASIIKLFFNYSVSEGTETAETIQRGLSNFRSIMSYLEDKNLYSLIGELTAVIQAQDFSTWDNISHLILFMSFLIRFCDFAFYWYDRTTMINGCELFDTLHFTEAQRADRAFIAEFHHEQSSKIARRMLKVLSTLEALPVPTQNLDSSIEYWAQRVEEIRKGSESE